MLESEPLFGGTVWSTVPHHGAVVSMDQSGVDGLIVRPKYRLCDPTITIFLFLILLIVFVKSKEFLITNGT